MRILAIETSCDETAASIITATDDRIIVQSNVISSQVKLHAQWGGVVPNLAAREHTKNIIPVLTEALTTADTTRDTIDLIAVTQCPGLIPALLSGVSAAKTLAYAWHKPLIGIHHIEGHIYANWLSADRMIIFPALALVVSGGHTQLILMSHHCHYVIIGETQDDAVGEAFDKVARILGLGYPGGPIISARAQKYADTCKENPLTLPQPMRSSGDFNFSFSGLKTAVLYLVKEYRKKNHLQEKDALPEDFIDQVAHAFQSATVDILTFKTLRAAKKYAPRSILLAGGVSANTQLRLSLGDMIATDLSDKELFVPALPYCLDNAAMIATAAYYRHQHMSKEVRESLTLQWKTLQAYAHHPLENVK
ncbi:MAG: tRNA (adenosine(37)-N6)-threonylcarbamoyltransferase complex transferase subunit TsaD [Parcubacteria group bacterium]|jgi:N6-L-threonylcarbamoyladenine synthase